MIYRTLVFAVVIFMKVNSMLVVERICYRRLVSGRRLDERFIRHSLPCDSLEACQHQCSIEKHFNCQGFNLRWTRQKASGGICELSAISSSHLDLARDFRFDPEFDYYERDYSTKSPNCGIINEVYGDPREEEDKGRRITPFVPGGPYQGGDSYGPWSSGHGGVEHGPWGQHGYGSGAYIPNNPAGRPPTPPYASAHFVPGPYYGSGGPYYDQRTNEIPYYRRYGEKVPPQNTIYYHEGKRYPPKLPEPPPTYVIIDSGPGGKPSGTPYPRPPNHGFYEGRRPGPPPGGAPGFYGPSNGGSPGFHGPSTGGSPGLYGLSTGGAPGSYGPPGGGSPGFPGPTPGGSPGYYGPGNGGSPGFYGPPAGGSPGFPGPTTGGSPGYYGPASGGSPGFYGPSPGGSPGFYRPSIGAYPGFHGPSGREVCFRRAQVGYRVDPKFVKVFHATQTVLDCEAMCTNSPFKCTGYGYRYSGPGGGEPNCALIDFSLGNSKKNLLPDRSCDIYYKMPTCSSGRSEDTDCFLKTYSNQRIAPDKIRRALFVRGVSDCELECLRSYHFTCRSFTFRYGPGVIGEPAENCFLSDWPVKDLHPTADYLPGPGCEVYERGSYGHGCELDGEPPSIGPGFGDVGYPLIHDKYHWNRQEMWRHFTVRGWPCRIGTQCQLNREAGFWSCPVEGGDSGQWDYCCKPGHHCGFSRGYYYPWCYVGEASPDQWRPCSEQFYPEFGNRYSYRPGASKPDPGHSLEQHKGSGPWNYGEEEYGPPSYWPILYLYAEPPPNVTESWILEDPHHSPYYLQEHYDDDPKIQFRPSKNRFSYPKGIVLKIDLKDKPVASDPGHEAHKHEVHSPHIHPRYNYRKNLNAVERVPLNDLNYPYHGIHNCEKESLKLQEDPVSSTSAPPLDFTGSKRDLSTTEKSKEVIRDVEKLIEEKTKVVGNETLDSGS
ncbi:UNVERIFIED_CONTAM: hypothetical protein PYX00_010532 [Menopon gallinae]|uniref:Apple domain-containing protein n=1 Tax=Menopon gallinae TaxID=328185 RepID=A0AAW2HGI0_9NEOP